MEPNSMTTESPAQEQESLPQAQPQRPALPQVDPLQLRFSEGTKFLPVAFVCLIIMGLWVVYVFLHCVPMLKDSDGPTSKRGLIHLIVILVLSFLLVCCYILCIVVHPGTIPDTPAWVIRDEAGLVEQAREPSLRTLEWKRTGSRRHCKWCQKYKPDRTHHCRVCRVCVLKMDHHCPWIYNCVGFRNHKYFFLLLLYSTCASNMIFWTMRETVSRAFEASAVLPFWRTFLVLFGETLAGFVTFLVTVFFMFHIYLMHKGMTTIEVCEKAFKRPAYDDGIYDRGLFGNLKAVLGDNVLLWPWPCGLPAGDGLEFCSEDARLWADRRQQDSSSTFAGEEKHKRPKKGHAGTGSAPGSEQGDSDDAGAGARSSRDPFLGDMGPGDPETGGCGTPPLQPQPDTGSRGSSEPAAPPAGLWESAAPPGERALAQGLERPGARRQHPAAVRFPTPIGL